MLTDWERYQDNLGDIVKVWEGGLGIPGGMLAGVLVGGYVGHVRRGIPLGAGLNAVAPALPLAQAIGRWGNYFNQELFGGPTDLPWALEIDQEHLPLPGTTFHPTFLYESLGNFALCGLLLWIDKRYRPAGGRLLAMYVLGYGVGRFWIEGLRIDAADELAGLVEPVGVDRPDRRRWPHLWRRGTSRRTRCPRSSTVRRPSMARLSPSPAETTTLPRP